MQAVELVGVEGGHDVGWPSRATASASRLEAEHGRLVPGEGRGQHLQRDDASHPAVPALKTMPMPPVPELVEDQVIADGQPPGLPLQERPGLVFRQPPGPDQFPGQGFGLPRSRLAREPLAGTPGPRPSISLTWINAPMNSSRVTPAVEPVPGVPATSVGGLRFAGTRETVWHISSHAASRSLIPEPQPSARSRVPSTHPARRSCRAPRSRP